MFLEFIEKILEEGVSMSSLIFLARSEILCENLEKILTKSWYIYFGTSTLLRPILLISDILK